MQTFVRSLFNVNCIKISNHVHLLLINNQKRNKLHYTNLAREIRMRKTTYRTFIIF